MYSRSERQTGIVSTGCTNEAVGPGSYAAAESLKQIKGPTAAFAWSGKRSTLPLRAHSAAADAEATPAQSQLPLRSWASSNASSSFSSETQRFVLDKEAVAKPGPGAYQTQPKWIQQQQQPPRQAAGSKQGPSHMPSTALIGCPVRVPDPSPPAAAAASPSTKKGPSTHAEVLLSTPPSIPARHQSFGYEAGPDGCLVMQPPPAQAANDAGKLAGKLGKLPSSRLRSPPRPSTVPDSRTAFGGAAGALANRSSSARYGPTAREPTRQLQQQLRAVYEPVGQGQQQRGNISPRFRPTAGGKLVLSRDVERAGTASAAFASKSARLHQQELDPEKLTPGPGAYNSKLSSSRPTSAPVAHAPFFSPPKARQPTPLFARTAGRSAALSIGPGWSLPPSKKLAPGPGTYNVTRSAADKAVHGVRSVRTPAQGVRASFTAAGAGAAAATGTGDAADKEAVAAGFGRTSRRFEDNSTVAPGPGKYTADQLMSMAADAARRAAAASKRGAFGTASSSRQHSVIDECLGISSSSGGNSQPGPGCYDTKPGLADRVAAAAVRPSPGFVSASDRFAAAAAPTAPDYSSFDGSTMRGDQTRLGPGAYLKLDDWRRGDSGTGRGSWHSGYHNAPFGSESGRHNLGAAADAPGPGCYAAVDVGKVFQPLSMPGKSGFATTSQRFKLKAATPETVGPGTYVQQSSLVKPSFNVTLDQS